MTFNVESSNLVRMHFRLNYPNIFVNSKKTVLECPFKMRATHKQSELFCFYTHLKVLILCIILFSKSAHVFLVCLLNQLQSCSFLSTPKIGSRTIIFHMQYSTCNITLEQTTPYKHYSKKHLSKGLEEKNIAVANLIKYA